MAVICVRGLILAMERYLGMQVLLRLHKRACGSGPAFFLLLANGIS